MIAKGLFPVLPENDKKEKTLRSRSLPRRPFQGPSEQQQQRDVRTEGKIFYRRDSS